MSIKKSNKNNSLLWEGDILHLVFQPSAKEVLEKSFEINDSVLGEIVIVKEDYSVGDLLDIYNEEGWQRRKRFWKQTIQQFDEEIVVSEMSEDKLLVHNIKHKLLEDENLHLWIWMAQNERDVCGYYWLITQLKELAGRMHILYLNNLPFIDEKGSIFYPSHLHQIQPKELVKARRLNRQISTAEIELDGDEWKKICNENAPVRTLEGGKKIISQSANYYDKILTDIIGRDIYKFPRLINQLIIKQKIEKPELFWMWRMKHLVEANVLIENGDWSKNKDISFKKNNGELFEIVSDTE